MNFSHRKKVGRANCPSCPSHHFKRTPEHQMRHHQSAGTNRMSKTKTGQFLFPFNHSLDFIFIPPDKKIRTCCRTVNREMNGFRTTFVRTKGFFIVETWHPASSPALARLFFNGCALRKTAAWLCLISR